MSEGELKGVPISIQCGFSTMEQKLVFEAVVLPEIVLVLKKYSALLGYETN